MRFALLIFIIVPLAEMLLLFEVAERVGGWTTLGLVVLTAVIGIQILKQQGLSTLTRANQRLNSGEMPAQEIVEGLFLAVGGAFLLTPGFITDTLGFLCLIGPTRRMFVKMLIRSGKVAMWQSGDQQQFFYTSYSERSRSAREKGDIYEGEFKEDPPDDEKNDRLGRD
ncbi:MAG: hypothetical protein CMP91_08710 [Gammaproteobacteria bacterium]|nr:hypothetical protein [Gammaproteobacteria bacterium]MAY02664.1 hypothetical protein [Gammaproteobacteria bacterium]